MKKILIITIMIVILMTSSCIKKQGPDPEPVKPDQILLSQIGTEGKLTHNESAYEILEMNNFDLWVLYLKKDKLTQQIKSSNSYTAIYNNLEYTLKQNPFNHNILKLLLPTHLKPEESKNIIIKAITARENGKIKNDIDLAIEKIYITKVTENATTLNEISVEDYTDLYGSGPNNFAYDGDQFIRPSHVKSNEENAYEVDTYFDARTVADTESATGAFQFLKDVGNYEQYIIMENPYRFRETDGSTELLAPDDRWRVRQLGDMGQLNGDNVFNIVDDPSKEQFTLSIDKEQLPSATYTGTYFWETQLKEATDCDFDKTGETNIFQTIIDYTDAPSTEIILNSRFQAVEYNQPEITLKTPTDSTGVGETSVILTWEATPGNRKKIRNNSSREPNDIEIREYNVYFATESADYPEPATTTDKHTEKTGLQYGTTYKWTVEAIQNDTQTASPASYTFTVGSIVVSKDGVVVNTYTKDELNTAVNEAETGSIIEIAVDLTLSQPITIDGTELTIRSMKTDENVTLDWNKNSEGFTIDNASVTLERLNIINCATDAENKAGALTINNSTLNIYHSEFASNTAVTAGAIFGYENSDITVENATITNNQAVISGAVCVVMSDLRIIDSYLAANTSQSIGGGLYINQSNATITRVELLQNQAEMGAAMFIMGSTSTIDGGVFEGNALVEKEASYKYGAGVYISSTSELPHSVLTITHSTFINMGAEKGAGIYINDGELTLYDNTFENLETTVGGAIYVDENKIYGSQARPVAEELPALYNSEGTEWKWFNAPEASVEFVENTSNNNNTYTNCTVNSNEEAEGAKIGHIQRTTPNGTLTLIPEEGTEQDRVTLNIYYQIGREYKGGTVTIDVPTGFEITENASVTIGEEPATNVTNYNWEAQTIDITGIDLTAEGTVTLKLKEQEIPDGVDPVTGQQRNVNYTFCAQADADGGGTAWEKTEETTVDFTSIALSTNTDFQLTGDDPRLIQYKTTDPATVLLAASGTTVGTILDNCTSTDASEQAYKIYDNTQDPLGEAAQLTEQATLVVTSKHGNTTEYTIDINQTDFIRLYAKTEASPSEGRQSRDGQYETTWHETIASAVASANTTKLSTITVWPGRYYAEQISFGFKPIHLTSIDPVSQTIRETTIIDGNEESFLLVVGSDTGSSEGTTTIEGFTITNAMGQEIPGISERSDYQQGVAISIKNMNAEIRNNIITQNGKEGQGASGIGIFGLGADVQIHDNVMSHNHTENQNGAGIHIINGSPIIYNNIIESNTGDQSGGGICLGHDELAEIYRPQIYNNTIRNNEAENGAGIYFYPNMEPKNADGELWRKFNAPNATVTFVEHNTQEASNNTYSDNTPIGEGHRIYFDISQKTPEGTLTLSPTEALQGEATSISMDFETTGYFRNASLTIHIPEAFGLTSSDASVTLEGEATEAINYGAEANANPFILNNLNMGPASEVTISFESTPTPAGGTYQFKVYADADGSGTAWEASDPASDNFEVIAPVYNFQLSINGQDPVGKETLQQAVDDASDSEPNRITILASNVGTEGGVEIDSKEITIVATTGYDLVTIDGEGKDERAFYIHHGASVTLDGLEIINCHYDGDNGGAVYGYYGSTLTISGGVFDSNRCQGNNGGAIGVYWNSDLKIENSTFTNNQAVYGGAVYTQDVFNLSIQNSTFTGNEADEGGAIYSKEIDENATIGSSLFQENHSSSSGAGAIHLYQQSAAANEIMITDTIVSSNTTNGGRGGGFYLEGNMKTQLAANKVQISNSTFTANTGAYKGGGIALQDFKASEIRITKTLFDSNTAETGDYASSGGILFFNMTIDDFEISYSTITSNISNKAGGILLNNLDLGNASITSCSITGNKSNGDSGGIQIAKTHGVTIDDSTIFNNEADSDGGGVRIFNGSSAIITDSEISSNTAINGGGVNISSYSCATITNTTISSNTATNGYGGGVYMYDTNGDADNFVDIDNCTFTFNEAATGAGVGSDIDSGSFTVRLFDSIFDTNTAEKAGGGIYVDSNVSVTNDLERAWLRKDYPNDDDNVTLEKIEQGGGDYSDAATNTYTGNNIDGVTTANGADIDFQDSN